MNKKSIYRKVAKEYGVSVQEVKQDELLRYAQREFLWKENGKG